MCFIQPIQRVLCVMMGKSQFTLDFLYFLRGLIFPLSFITLQVMKALEVFIDVLLLIINKLGF